jgi:glycosyltransferase involved in cell wall biosynthesis
MWAFTGGCHYSDTCQNFLKECGNCPMLQDSADNDISREGWLRKQAMYKAKNIVFVTCSNWLAGIARTSPLLKGFRIEAIPNPIDTTIYGPQNQAEVRKAWNIDTDAKILVFGAANIMHTRKGIAYLIEALHHLKADYPKQGTIEIVLFGKSIGFDMGKIPFKVHDMGVIVDQRKLAQIYNLADVFVLPSLEDNLPNMVMESLACGVPVVAFNTGGIPDMVEHEKNGYLAEYKSATDMAKGINYILTTPQLPGLKEAARAKVVKNFTNAVVSAKYKALYQSLLKK